MKHTIIGVFLVIGLTGAVFALQGTEAPEPNHGISIGGGTSLASFTSGGFLEVGFPLLESAKTEVRDYLSLDGYGTSPTVGGGWNVPTAPATDGPPFSTGYALIRAGFRAFL